MRVITNLTRNTVLADRAELATGVLRRMVGLLSRRSLGAGEALVFPRCNSIHTCFMRFPIDVVFVKSIQGSSMSGVVVKVVEALPAFRFTWTGEADTVVELPVGTISTSGTKAGEFLELA